LKGDFNGDGGVDGVDSAVFANTFGSSSGDANYDPDNDFNANGTVGVDDLAASTEDYGRNKNMNKEEDMSKTNLAIKLIYAVFFITTLGIGYLCLNSSFAAASLPCSGDFDYDRDVDGKDLAQFATTFIADPSLEEITLFAQEFGKNDVTISINFSQLPEYPNISGEHLEGFVKGVDPEEYYMAVYIRVEDVWWTKPTYALPKRSIDLDCSWWCDIVTDENDVYATDVASFLIPVEIEVPPICEPCCTLPEIPDAIAFASEYIGPPQRTISFAGYDWNVKKRDFRAGPGQNFFSDGDQDVRVDEEGLHLTITSKGDDWYCTEVILSASLGYGTYIIHTHGRVDIIDPNMVLGLFTWDTEACDQSNRELDIEFTRWGDAEEYTNFQYVVAPCMECPGCEDRCKRCRVDLTDENSDLTNYLVWQPGTVSFRTYYGHHLSEPPIEELVCKWTYNAEFVPEPGKENIRFNFWLNEGNEPVGGQGEEMVISGFAYQEEPITWSGEELEVLTNLSNYPIAGCFQGADQILINDETVTKDEYDGFREDVVLDPGLNNFEIKAIMNGQAIETSLLKVTYDPITSTEEHTILYCHNTDMPETILIDLDQGVILGVLYGARIVAATHNGRYVIDLQGNVYQTSDHSVIDPPLPFSHTEVYPVFSGDDQFCYGFNEKIRFADRTLISDLIPVSVDGRFATLLASGFLIQGANSLFMTLDLVSDEIVTETDFSRLRVNWGTSASSPSGALGFVTSYSFAVGAIEIIDMNTGSTTSQFNSLSDYMGQIAFSNDGSSAFIGSYGNSYYGKGGIYVIDVVSQNLLSYFEQFGASSVSVGPDDLVYISSRYVDHFGNGTVVQGSKDRRGIDVLYLRGDNELQFIKTYYLNYDHHYSSKPTFFIKPGSTGTSISK
jgi:hypothetical protein